MKLHSFVPLVVWQSTHWLKMRCVLPIGSGNVVGMTDEQQNVVAEYTYDAWGTLLSSSGSEAVNNTYRFSTKEYFAETGLYNYGYRFYSPGMGRWINRDPLGEAGALNLYTFGPNSPVNGYDPYGMSWLVFNQESWDNLGSDMAAGSWAWLDGFNPFGDPAKDLGLYNPDCTPGTDISHFLGNVSRDALIAAGTAGAGSGALNSAKNTRYILPNSARPVVKEFTRAAYDDFAAMNGKIIMRRSEAPFIGKERLYGAYDPVKNQIHLFREQNVTFWWRN